MKESCYLLFHGLLVYVCVHRLPPRTLLGNFSIMLFVWLSKKNHAATGFIDS